MHSLAVKQQQTNRAHGFASGHHLGACVLVWVRDCVFDLFLGNYVKVTALESSEVWSFHPLNCKTCCRVTKTVAT